MKQGHLSDRIQWKTFLAKHDLTWPELVFHQGYMEPTNPGRTPRHAYEWGEGAFLGNGMLGAMIYKDSSQTLRWELGRCDVVAHHFLEGIDWATPRVSIGDFLLIPNQQVLSETMHLSLWDAEASGTMTTVSGKLRWRSIVHAERDLLMIEVISDTPNLGATLAFRPEHGVSHRIQYANAPHPLPKQLPPKPFQFRKGETQISVQTFIKDAGEEGMLPEGECAVAWREVELSPTHKILYATVTNSRTDNSARDTAFKLVSEAAQEAAEQLYDSHRAWWHRYYPSSFVSLPDSRWESIYWIQMYKLACATRSNGALIDSQGPWLTLTLWPTTVWNLNVQLSYMPTYTANRLHLAESLVRALYDNKEVLRENAKPSGVQDAMFIGRATNPVDLRSPWPSTSEIGNLTWTLHNVWRHYKVSMDRPLLEKVYLMLRENVNLYLGLLRKGEDGKYHLPDTSSPEYPVLPKKTFYPILDCTYSLALLRFACTALLEANEELQRKDPLSERWRDVLEHLVDYPTNENGFMIGAEVPFTVSHRHFSHMLMAYPLQQINFDDEAEREGLKRSLEYWIGTEGNLEGYSFTAAAAMMALLGDGNEALRYLNGLRDYLLPNTMYMEAGPVIETPIASAESIHYMLLQCWGGVIRVFPALPDEWQDVAFADLLADGAFEISANRRNGITEFVHIRSLKGGTCRIHPNLTGEVKGDGIEADRFKIMKDGSVHIAFREQECMTLYTGDTCKTVAIAPVQGEESCRNFYGAQKSTEDTARKAEVNANYG